MTQQNNDKWGILNEDEVAYVVRKTMDYDKFKILLGNREKDELHFRRMVNAIQKRYLLTIIIVNERGEIIDGQHRYYTARQLGLPIYYVVAQGYGLDEVHIYNELNLRFGKAHYLQGFCQLGAQPYLEFKKFRKDFPDFGLGLAENILCDKTSAGVLTGQGVETKGLRRRNFEEGRLFIPNLKKSYDTANKIMDFKDYFKGYNSANFVKSMIKILRNKNYDHKAMLKKCKKYPMMLKATLNIADCELMIENLYNYRSSVKVNLRY